MEKYLRRIYALNSDVFESFRFNEEVSKENLVYDYKITYENRPITSDVELNLALLSNDVGYEGNYEQFDHEGKTYYYAKIVERMRSILHIAILVILNPVKVIKPLVILCSFAVADSSENGS